MVKTGVHWFRNDLRIHDNPALMACLEQVERFIPIYIFDNKTSGTDLCGFVRFRFLLESIKNLETQFKDFRINFMCFYGEPHQVLEKLIKENCVQVVSFQRDSEAIYIKRDKLVKEMCQKHQVEVIERVSHTLYDPKEVLELNKGLPANTYEDFKKICLKIGEPEEPIPAPDLNFFSLHLVHTNDIYVENEHKVKDLNFFNKKPECQEQKYSVYKGGETRALSLFKRRLHQEKQTFKKGQANPNLTKPILFTQEISLSPYFRYGCLSVRKFYAKINSAYNKHFTGEKTSFFPHEQLLWRDYFYHLACNNEKFDRIQGNIQSFKIPWDYEDKQRLHLKWEEGNTGFPWIDACMRQLRQEGWIHHIGRNSLAIFLTRGQLWLSWEVGAQTFLKFLIDGDWAVNAGNWNWISAGDPEEIMTSNSVICPVKNAKKVDSNGIYIKKYIPELRNFPIKYLFEPWKAPLEVQIDANCIIGKDYPEPCVDHKQTAFENLAKLKHFYENESKKPVNVAFESETNAIRPSNTNEYKVFTYASFLNIFEDF